MGTDLLTRPQARLVRVGGPLFLAGGVAAASIALHFRDPHQDGSWGFCPFHEITGLYCPGCGGLRAVNDLTGGDVLAAASSNLLFVVTLPLVAFLWVRWVRAEWTGAVVGPGTGMGAGMARRRKLVAGVVLGAAFVFTVVRNTGWGSSLAP